MAPGDLLLPVAPLRVSWGPGASGSSSAQWRSYCYLPGGHIGRLPEGSMGRASVILVMSAMARERKLASHIPGMCYPKTSRSPEAIPTLALWNPTKYPPVKTAHGSRKYWLGN